MAVWRKTLSSTIKEVDMCSSFFYVTKYTYIECKIPTCNKCSISEANEDTPGWVAGQKESGFASRAQKTARKADCFASVHAKNENQI